MKRLLVLSVLLSTVGLALAADSIPRECVRYRREFVRNHRMVWGADAPIATLAAQMLQESRCNPNARSAYASGLTQFTPDTADWVNRLFPDLENGVPTNPIWAWRAQSHYVKRLKDGAPGATDCDSMWFALWGYNGGPGWVQRDRRLAQRAGADPQRHEAVEPFNAGRAPAMFRENRNYPSVIINRWQPLFVAAGWGEGSCQ